MKGGICKKRMKYVLKWIVWILVVIGALNWGFVGFFTYNPILTLLGVGITRVVYDLVGLSAVVLIVFKVLKMKGMRKKRRR
jgi:hypothetical protein